MKVLVSGISGYIGSVLAHLLVGRGHEVVGIDAGYKGHDSLLGIRKNLMLIEGDICNIADLSRIPDVDAVVNLAAIVGDPACKKYPQLAKSVNYNGVRALYATAVKRKAKKFIQASTCSVYGLSEYVIDEDGERNPLSLYAQTKAMAEDFLLESNPIPSFILRFSTAFGASFNLRFDLTVNEFTKDLWMDRVLTVYQKDTWRPYCHTIDISVAIIKALESDFRGGVYNVGTDSNNYTKAMIIDDIKNTFESGGVVYVDGNDADRRNYFVKFGKIQRDLGFEAQKTVKDGILDIVELLRGGIDGDDPKYRSDYLVAESVS